MCKTSGPRLLISLVALFIFDIAGHVQASILVPDGLSPGQTYHLVFVTSGETTAESDVINDYNNFVNEQAGVSGAITENWDIDWYAMGSTSLVDARVNALVTGPVFGLDGTKIADDHDDVWDGSLDSPLYVNQHGEVLLTTVWTGSFTDGRPRGSAGSSQYRPLGYETSEFGATAGIAHPLDAYPFSSGDWIYMLSSELSTEYSMYALSEPLFVPDTNPIPEPASVITWALLGAVGCIGTWWNRRRKAG